MATSSSSSQSAGAAGSGGSNSGSSTTGVSSSSTSSSSVSAPTPSPAPAEVLRYTKATSDFLCPLSANTYGIEFLAFKIRDMESNTVVFEVAKDGETVGGAVEYPPNFDVNQLRSIQYTFPAQFLLYKTVGTTLRFKVGPEEVRQFRMIERHYCKGKLIKSYDFTFEFCIPNSTNEWEAIYEMPALDRNTLDDLLEEGSLSDSFYFVGEKLIMHNKAQYHFQADEQFIQQLHSSARAGASSSSKLKSRPDDAM